MKKVLQFLSATILFFSVSGCQTATVQEDQAMSPSPIASNSLASYQKISSYMEEECKKVFSPYYELLDFTVSDYQETAVNENVEATFGYKVIHKNFDKDPDTVDYIKKAKETGDPHYQQLHDEYLAPKEMNFQLKAVIDKADAITLYSNVSPKGVQWEKVSMADFLINQ